MTEKERLIWVAKNLFDHGKTTGTTGNLSISDGNRIWVSAGGSCFGTLEENDFAELDYDGKLLAGKKPSKEWPIHVMLHVNRKEPGVVLHTHSFFATLWSCLPNLDGNDAIPAFTPYLRMKCGKVRLIPYAAPGSPELFKSFAENISSDYSAYLLAHHGAVVSAKDAMSAYALIEELEEAAKIAWFAKNTLAETI